jgi:serine/threonine-protein kinase
MPELCLKVVTEPPMSLAELRPDAPPALVEIVARCLEKEPDRRFANAAELSTALEPLVPAASRVTVERARLAIRTTARNPQAAAPHPLATSPTLVAPEAPARTGPTPAAWDSRNAAAQGPAKSRNPAVWIGVGFAAAAAVAIAAMLLRAPAESKSPVSLPTAAAAPPPPVTTPLPTVTTAAADPPASSAAAATPTQSAPTASVAPKPAPLPGRMVPVGPTGPKAAAKPKDDDIPSLR